MNVGKSYRLIEFLSWTRRRIYLLVLLAPLPIVLYQVFGLKWIAVPWPVVVLLGTATSFIVGFKNAQTYGRTVEAQQVWTAIAGTSRYWGIISRDFSSNPESSKSLIYRHIAWLTVLRYKLRTSRVWESVQRGSNAEYRQKFYSVPEQETALEAELEKYLSADEINRLASAKSKTTWLMNIQSEAVKAMAANQQITALHQLDMLKTIKDFLDQQSKVERIKNFPYPRQYSIINTIFVWCFAVLLPFCMVREFDRLNDGMSGLLSGHMVWLAAPFSLLIAWAYLALDQVGESTENPFEGGANDVPIAQICRMVEIELREVLGETQLPPLLRPRNQIIL